MTKLTARQRRTIRERFDTGDTLEELARDYACDNAAIGRCILELCVYDLDAALLMSGGNWSRLEGPVRVAGEPAYRVRW